MKQSKFCANFIIIPLSCGARGNCKNREERGEGRDEQDYVIAAFTGPLWIAFNRNWMRRGKISSFAGRTMARGAHNDPPRFPLHAEFINHEHRIFLTIHRFEYTSPRFPDSVVNEITNRATHASCCTMRIHIVNCTFRNEIFLVNSGNKVLCGTFTDCTY